ERLVLVYANSRYRWICNGAKNLNRLAAAIGVSDSLKRHGACGHQQVKINVDNLFRDGVSSRAVPASVVFLHADGIAVSEAIFSQTVHHTSDGFVQKQD